VFQETAMPCRHLFNATTHEDRSTGILPNVPNDDDDDDDEKKLTRLTLFILLIYVDVYVYPH